MQKKIIVVGMVIILLLNAILVGNVNAIASKVTVTKVGECPDLLKYNGEVIECTKICL